LAGVDEEIMDGWLERVVPAVDWKDGEKETSGALELEHAIR